MNPKNRTRLLIVDDHPMVRAGLKALLATYSDMDVVAEAGTGLEALAAFRCHRPDVVLLDLNLPDLAGTEVAAALRREDSGARIIMVSSYGGEADIRSSLEAGAKGYLLKDAPSEELVSTVRRVAMGLTGVSARAAMRLEVGSQFKNLSEREMQILELIVKGRSNKEIASKLDITEGTVKGYVHGLLSKLGAKSRTEAISKSLQRGLVRLP